MAKLSQLTIPVKNPSTGAVSSQTFDLAGSGGSDTNFIGTKAAYDALPSSEKEAIDSMDFTDYNEGTIDPVPMINSKNPVASGGVYAKDQILSNEITDAVELVAPLEPALVATRNYAVGKQFVYNGFLYKVTAPIALDDEIVIGTNCQLAPCVTEQINAITGQIADVNTALAGKQDKLTNPLVQSDVVNGVTSTATNKPLSAYQGKLLWDKMRVCTLLGNAKTPTTANTAVTVNLSESIHNFLLIYVMYGFGWGASHTMVFPSNANTGVPFYPSGQATTFTRFDIAATYIKVTTGASDLGHPSADDRVYVYGVIRIN